MASLGRRFPSPDHIEVDTPAGRLSVTWPRPLFVYSGLGVIAEVETGAEPAALPGGRPVSLEQAREIAREAAAASRARRAAGGLRWAAGLPSGGTLRDGMTGPRSRRLAPASGHG